MFFYIRTFAYFASEWHSFLRQFFANSPLTAHRNARKPILHPFAERTLISAYFTCKEREREAEGQMANGERQKAKS